MDVTGDDALVADHILVHDERSTIGFILKSGKHVTACITNAELRCIRHDVSLSVLVLDDRTRDLSFSLIEDEGVADPDASTRWANTPAFGIAMSRVLIRIETGIPTLVAHGIGTVFAGFIVVEHIAGTGIVVSAFAIGAPVKVNDATNTKTKDQDDPDDLNGKASRGNHRTSYRISLLLAVVAIISAVVELVGVPTPIDTIVQHSRLTIHITGADLGGQ